MNPASLVGHAETVSKNIISPFSYMIVCLTLWTILFLLFENLAQALGARGVKRTERFFPYNEKQQKQIDDMSKSFYELDAKRISVINIPIIALMGTHAALVFELFNISGSHVTYRLVISANCYFVGTFVLLFAALFIGSILVRPWWGAFYFSIPIRGGSGWKRIVLKGVFIVSMTILLKIFHSYVILLSEYSSCSVLFTLGVWFIGSLGFFVIVLLACLWYYAIK